MKKKTPYLDFYKKHVKSGRLPMAGLCDCLDDEFKDFYNPIMGGCSFLREMTGYWGHGDVEAMFLDRMYEFTPLRQTLVLLMAAYKGEL